MRISRHARNNMRLYKIGEGDILEAIKSPDMSDKEGNKMIAIKKFQNKFSDYPLKVVYNEDENFIITVYPLKKKKWR